MPFWYLVFTPFAYDPGLRGTRLVSALDGLQYKAVFGGRKQVRGAPEVRISVGWTSGDVGLMWEYYGAMWEYYGEPLSPLSNSYPAV